jgi:uncharacterized protein YggE
MKQVNSISFFTSILLIVFLVITFNEYQDVKEKKEWTILNIQGKEKVEINPDTAIFTLTIEENGMKEDKVLSSVKIKTDKVLTILKDNGISTDEIETSYLNSGKQQHHYDTQGFKPNDVYIYNSIQVNTKSIDTIENIFDEISVINGVNFNGLYYELDNIEKIQDELAAVATENARNKAENIAKSLKTKIKGIKSIQTEHNNYGINPAFGSKDMAVSNSSGTMVAEAIRPEINNIPIFKKKIEVQAIVFVEFYVH